MSFEKSFLIQNIMKEYPSRISLEEIWKHFEGFPLAHLATMDKNQPRVRPMSLISFNGKLWLATKTEWNKVEQIRHNNRVEFTIAPVSKDGTGSVRVSANAIIVEDRETRFRLSSQIPWFNQYWSDANNHNFTLIRLDIRQILYDHPSDSKKYTVILT
jgi:general stress protein 26